MFTLSICISTRNRSRFLAEALDGVIAQATHECEIVVLDGASTDDTESVVAARRQRFPNIQYFKQLENNGLDGGFDHAVQLARGEYCWLMPDDDLLNPGAMTAVLAALTRKYSLVVVNVEYRTFDMSSVIDIEDLQITDTADREFSSDALDELFEACWRLIRYTGSIVIKREIWLARERKKFYGSFWMDVAIVFQQKLPCGAYLISAPCVSVRMGNQSWLLHSFDIFCVSWPKVVSALAISSAAKKKASVDEPWRRTMFLLLHRAAGQYSLIDYRRYIKPRLSSMRQRIFAAAIAIFPGRLLNMILLSYYSGVRTHYARSVRICLEQSRFNSAARERNVLPAAVSRGDGQKS